MKKIFLLIIISLLLISCETSKISTYEVEENQSSETDSVQIENSPNIEYKLSSDNLLSSIEESYSQFAMFILELINSKDWEELSNYTDIDFYYEYFSEDSVSYMDYCMYMLYTGDEGIATNYSLDQIKEAYLHPQIL